MTGKTSSSTPDSRSLLVIALDVSGLAWGERDLKRAAQDKARLAAGKRSIGPAILSEVLEAVQAFSSAFCNIERDSGLIVIGVADNETAVVYPRKDALDEWLSHPENFTADTSILRADLTSGVAELVKRASVKAEKSSSASSRQAAMASAFSSALCLINRFLVAARAGGVSALQNEHYLNRAEDEGVIALIGGDKKSKKSPNHPRVWSPRILLVQASEDRAKDYNAMMNCAFAAVKQHIVVDGCYLAASGNKESSAFLEQACDLTSGVFLAPSGAAQVDGALTEVMYSVFLAPLGCRRSLNLPALNKVDFRARSFESAEMVDMAFVCNQCLSIFKSKPKGTCPTCQAKIISESKKAKISS